MRRSQLRIRIDREDILKAIYRASQRGETPTIALREQLEVSRLNWERALRYLRRNAWMESDALQLTTKGERGAQRLVRAHRLWETYLATEVGLGKEQIHPDAERYEHLLSDEVLAAVDKHLGFPQVDPHGSPIPRTRAIPEFSLSSLDAGEEAVLTLNQDGSAVSAFLWREQLQAGKAVKVLHKDAEGVTVEQDGRRITVPLYLADQVHVAPQLTE